MNKKNWAIFLLLIVHIAGIIGMLSPLRHLFLLLTPLNLLISLFLLLRFHEGPTTKFYYTMVFIMIAGFIIEVVGVNTGWPFGEYQYGEPLGPQFMGTPFMIGVNWFILTYCGAMLFRNTSKSRVLNAILAGLAITLFDIILEPVAIHLNFWSWSGNAVPIQNYITWAVCISFFSYLLYKIESQYKNPISNWVLGVQVLFFACILIGSQL